MVRWLIKPGTRVEEEIAPFSVHHPRSFSYIMLFQNVFKIARIKNRSLTLEIINHFCPALTKLALDLHVNFCLFVCLSVCLSGLFFKASNWMIYWLLTVVLAPYLSD